METKIKWNNGDGNIIAAYSGSGDAPIDISSDTPNEGIDREQTIQVATVDNTKSVDVLVKQPGLRQRFITSDGLVFCVADGGRFAVLKQGSNPDVPDEPVETYTRLTYIECDGQQYIDLGYTVKEDDVIEADFILTNVDSADHFLFGTAAPDAGLWFEFYSKTAYVRFGASTSKSISSSAGKYSIRLEKGKVTIGGTSTTLDFKQMPNNTINLFAGKQSSGAAYSRGHYRCTKFSISDSNGLVMNLMPVKRDSDGVIGMLDTVSDTFYTSAEEPFISGSELKITSGYELVDSVSFNADKKFEACVIKSSYSIEVQWKKASASGSQYLFGIVTSPHTATVTAYIGSGAVWRWGKTSAAYSTDNTDMHFAVVENGQIDVDKSTKTISAQSFETADTLIVGGVRAANGTTAAQYAGKIFFFRIKDGDSYILDWYPCKRLSDSVEGFWDCVSQSFIEPM